MAHVRDFLKLPLQMQFWLCCLVQCLLPFHIKWWAYLYFLLTLLLMVKLTGSYGVLVVDLCLVTFFLNNKDQVS